MGFTLRSIPPGSGLAPFAFIYTPASLVAAVGEILAFGPPAVAGTAPITFTALGLPSWLTINPTTGVISGTAPNAQGATGYTVIATNEFGATSTTVTLTVSTAEIVPHNFAYSPGTVFAPVGGTIMLGPPAIAGATPMSFSAPTLPAWLSIDPATGVISGIAPAIQAPTDYEVIATNAYGTASTTVNVEVVVAGVAPSGLSYTPDTVDVAVGTSVSFGPPTVSGTSPITFSGSGLPSWLNLNPATGALTGTPTGVQAEATYTIRATNAYGYVETHVHVTVGQLPTGLSYAPAAASVQVGQHISLGPPALSAFPAAVFTAPTLPAGLTIDSATGVISGVAFAEQAGTSYTVRATNSYGYTETTVSVTVTAAAVAPSNLVYSPGTVLGRTGGAVSLGPPTVTGTTPMTFSATGLPAWLSINAATGVISGTPTAEQALTDYTVRATNVAGFVETTVHIQVGSAPSAFSYSPASATVAVGSPVSLGPPAVSGAAPITFSGVGLPGWLTVNSSTGVVSGTPPLAQGATTYTIRATNAFGSLDTTVSVTAGVAPSAFSYSPSSADVAVGSLLSLGPPAVTGTTPMTFSATGLPAWLSINAATGVISGTPPAAQGATNYTVRATNVAGFVETTISVTVGTVPSAFSYSPASAGVAVGSPVSLGPPSVSGTAPITFSATGLPGWLTLNSSTGALTGTPSGTQASTGYTIRATNAYGHVDTTVFVTVGAVPSAFSYSPNSASVAAGSPVSLGPPSVSGTAPITFSATGLPGWLSLNSTTGALTGTPSAVQSATAYTIRATNPYGYVETTVTITVTAGAATYSISGAFTGAARPTTITVSLSGAAVATVSPDASGNFSFPELANGSYTVTPTRVGYSFSPASRSVTVSGANQTGQNFSTSLVGGSYIIQGGVINDGTIPDLTAVTMTLSGDANQTYHPNAGGWYPFVSLPAGLYTVTPSLAGFYFTPASRNIVLQGDSSGNDFTPHSGAVTVFTVSGTVSGVASPTTVSVTLAGIGTVTCDSGGNFSFQNVPPGTYALTPSLSGYSFSPTSLSVTVSTADVTGQNFAGTAAPTYTISGTIIGVTDPTAVTMTLTGRGTAHPSANGNFSFANVPAGTYTLTPSCLGYNFSPTNRSVVVSSADVPGQGFTGSPDLSTYTISGTITGVPNPTAISVALTGAGTGTTNPDASGNYSFASRPNGAYNVTPTLSGYNFNPASRGVTVAGANQTSQDFTGYATGSLYALPAARGTAWNPGLLEYGGIPNYTNVFQTIGPPSGDMASTIQSVLDAAGAAATDGVGRVVKLGSGTYNIGTQLAIPSKVVLRGNGMSGNNFNTTVYYTGTDGNVVRFGFLWINEGGTTNLAVTAAKGATQVQVASASGFTAGMLVTIDELTDDSFVWWHPTKHPPGQNRNWYNRNDRPTSQTCRIASINGNTVTLERPLHVAFRTSFGAQMTRFAGGGGAPAEYAGVEDLRVTHCRGTKGNVYFNSAYRCWAKHIEGDDSIGSCVIFENSTQCEVRDSYLHDTAYPSPGGNGYGIDIRRSASDCLVENNVVIRFNKVINGRACGGGNVIAYNYMDDGYIEYAPDWVETGLQVSHYPWNHFTLFEGNYCFNSHADSTEGNAGYQTFFRNHLSGERLKSVAGLVDGGNVLCAGAMRNHWYYNFVGNVLGKAGVNYSAWQLDDQGPWGAGDKAIWRFGHWNEDYNSNDPQVFATALQDGDYDYKSQTVRWRGIGGAGSTPLTLPDSLYRGSRGKPSFFGTNTWPWVTSTGSTKVYVLPAKARYDAGTPNAVSL